MFVRFTLPDDQNSPAEPFQCSPDPLVARNVCRKFRLPEIRARTWVGSETALGMTMPKAAVHKYNCSVLRQNDVRLPREIRRVQPVSKACTVQESPYLEFRNGVLGSNTCHHAGSDGLVNNICHGALVLFLSQTAMRQLV